MELEIHQRIVGFKEYYKWMVKFFIKRMLLGCKKAMGKRRLADSSFSNYLIIWLTRNKFVSYVQPGYWTFTACVLWLFICTLVLAICRWNIDMQSVEFAPDCLLWQINNASDDEVIGIAKVLWGIWFFRSKKVWENKSVTHFVGKDWSVKMFSDRETAK